MARRSCTLLAVVLAVGWFAPARAADEAAIGAQVYRDLVRKGVLVDASPWYAVLNQIGSKIAAVANAQYAYPFRFILVSDKNPNAFAVPGGNIYVTVPMMTFVKTKEELAGVLCHEVAHDIHHDVPQLNRKAQTTNVVAAGLAVLIGGGNNQSLNAILGAGAHLQGLHYARGVEENADTAGARICAQANYNPWGMVWLFASFSKANAGGTFEMLSDHPNDSHRISRLERLFAAEPNTFARFNRNRSSGAPIPVLASLRSQFGDAKPAAPAKRPGY